MSKTISVKPVEFNIECPLCRSKMYVPAFTRNAHQWFECQSCRSCFTNTEPYEEGTLCFAEDTQLIFPGPFRAGRGWSALALQHDYKLFNNCSLVPSEAGIYNYATKQGYNLLTYTPEKFVFEKAIQENE